MDMPAASDPLEDHETIIAASGLLKFDSLEMGNKMKQCFSSATSKKHLHGTLRSYDSICEARQ